MMQDNDRYARQMLLPEIGAEGQEKLRRARVLLVGAGGLGSPIALYLVGAGIGNLTIVDDDVVSVSNLHRQVLYGEDEVGQPKAECAARACVGSTVRYRLRPSPPALQKKMPTWWPATMP